jgi:hypothetical protein
MRKAALNEWPLSDALITSLNVRVWAIVLKKSELGAGEGWRWITL